MPSDFGRIHGMGTRIIRRLQEVGVLTFSDLKSLTDDEIARRLAPKVVVTPAQVAKLAWRKQASQLAAESAPHKANCGREALDLQATSFVVELYLDGERRVNRTRILDVKTGDEDAWRSWDENRLLDFFANRPELDLSGHTMQEPPLAEPIPVPAPAATPQAKSGNGMFHAVVSSSRLDIIPDGRAEPSATLVHDQPFRIQLAMGLIGAGAAEGPLDYTAEIMAKDMAGCNLLNLARVTGTAGVHNDVALQAPGISPPPGTYRTRAIVTLFDSKAKGRPVILRSIVEGSLLQVD